MALTQSVAPSIEPVSLDEAKLHAGIDGDEINSLVGNLWIPSARITAETATGRQFINATWEWKLSHFPASGEFVVPKPPLSSITSIQYIDTAGATQTLATSVYDVDTTSEPGRVALAYNQSWPATRGDINAVTVTFVAGYGTARTDVPANFRHAMLLLIGHANEHREEASEVREMKVIPKGASSLLFSGKMVEVG